MAKKPFTRGAALATARAMLRQGRPRAMVREHLLERGATQAEADSILEELSDLATQATLVESRANLKPIQSKTYLKQSKTPSIRDIIEQEPEAQAPRKRKISIDYDALDRSSKRKYQNQVRYPPKRGASSGSARVGIGLVIMIIGCAVTFFSYQAAANSSSGGTYVIAWGAILWGGWMVLRGLMSAGD